jgi:hypothetical protein
VSCSGCQVSSVGRATMIRRAGVLILTLGLLAAPLAVQGQQAGKVARLGFLGGYHPFRLRGAG